MADEDSEGWYELIEGARKDLYRSTKGLGGTLLGSQHGGLKREAYLGMFLDKTQMELISGIKRVFDPHFILNPGKIVDP